MPVAKVRGVNIFHQVIGDRGPWVALITGGRRGHDEFVPLATKLANAGYRVVLHDRRNTGRSDVLIEGRRPRGNPLARRSARSPEAARRAAVLRRRLVGGRAHRDAVLHALPQ